MAEALRAAEPDLVILNETGYMGFRLRQFSRRLEMEGSTGASLRWRIPNAVLARRPWRVVKGQVAVLPRTGRTVRRGAVMAQMGRSGIRLWVVAVHLGLSGQERESHARTLTDLLSGRHPTVVGGDLNEDATGSAVRWISGRYWDVVADTPEAATFPAKEPRARIDYLFVSEGIHLDRSWTGDDRFVRLSDHRPVFADLSLPG
jgi:endonuclease/exonuclease/phosphatase family metal-dependent hydrolase